MISSIKIKNFRGFKSAHLEDCRRVNVIVGENASGKSSLLEAIFLAGSTSLDGAARLRQWRGYEGAFTGTESQVQKALWADLFFGYAVKGEVSIELEGDPSESRSVSLKPVASAVVIDIAKGRSASSGAVEFKWRGPQGRAHQSVATLEDGKLKFSSGPEVKIDTVMFTSSASFGGVEAASRFSELSKRDDTRDVLEVMSAQFPRLRGLSVELLAGQPMIYAALSDAPEKMPVNSLSSGVNKLLNILLAMKSFPKGAVLIDEIENGFYYKRQSFVWRAILDMAKRNDVQVFATTHSAECLEALVSVSEGEDAKVSLIKASHKDGQSVLRQFTGSALRAGIEYEEELR